MNWRLVEKYAVAVLYPVMVVSMTITWTLEAVGLDNRYYHLIINAQNEPMSQLAFFLIVLIALNIVDVYQGGIKDGDDEK